MATQQEIEDLKKGWHEDPCWDIECTDGFEDHKEELTAYRKQEEHKREKNRLNHLEKMACDLGIAGNINLMRHIERIEDRIERLEELLNR